MYWKYFHAGAGLLSLMLFVVIFLIAQVLFIGTDYWLTLWTNAEELRYLASGRSTETNTTESNYSELNMTGFSLTDYFTTESSLMDANSTDEIATASNWTQNIDTNTGVYVYSIMIVGLFIFIMIRTTYFYVICMSASIKLHNKMFESIIRAKLVFFDQNPVGK